MKMVPDGYYCSACETRVTEAGAKEIVFCQSPVVRVLHHIGLQHNDGKCMSGRVSPVLREDYS